MKQFLLSILYYAVLLTASAQNSLPETAAENEFNRAIEHFNKKQFLTSRSIFESYLDHYPDHYRNSEANYYIAFNAINSGQKDAEYLMSNFVAKNPSHPKALSAYFDLGNYYFQQGSYSKAIKYYDQVNFESLSAESRYEGQFKLGYCYYSIKKENEALQLFDQVSKTRNNYYEDALYYAGIIQYGRGDYEQTIVSLLEAEKNNKYEDLTPEIIGGSYLILGQYDDLIRYINGLGQVKLQREIQLLTAEAYFHKEDYFKASELYQLALSSNRGKVSPVIYYHQGFSDYKAGYDSKAIEAFKIAALSSDTIGQYASYHLGILYTKGDNKQFALNAFKESSKSDLSLPIKEESSFRVGQLNYELGLFAISIDRLGEFLSEYSNSSFQALANDLLSDAYLKTSNYDLAINHIEALRNRSQTINKVYQQVTLLKGTQLFNDSQFSPAIAMFNKSLATPIDAELSVAANYWKGESYSIGQKWVDAINAYSKVVFNRGSVNSPYYIKSRYGLGYAYYNTKVYDRAKIQFAEYSKALNGAYDQPQYLDALIRLGDCYFAEKNYSAAITNYENALRGRSKDKAYIHLQLGLNYGFQGKNPQAKRNFQQVIDNYKDSREAERSAYQMAQMDLESGQFNEATKEFTVLIDDYSKSKLVPNALIKRGVANFNLQNYAGATADYQRVLDDFITHQVANSALLGLQEIASVSSSNIDIDSYIEKYRQANPNDSSLENIEFESAKNRYFTQDYEGAIIRFKSFNSTYPESSMAGEALYFIADAYHRSDNESEALSYFYKALDFPQISYFNRSILRIADIEYKLSNYPVAIKHYNWLVQNSRNKRETYNGLEGLMLSYDKLGTLDSVQWYANQILAEDQVSANGSSSANLYLGKSAISEEKYDKATNYLNQTIEIADDENAAEATYLVGFILNKQSKYTESNEILFGMNSKFSIYEFWLGKSFLLIADNYLETEELFQAEATLNSVIEKSPIDEIVASAREKLTIINEREKEIIEEKAISDTTEVKNGNGK